MGFWDYVGRGLGLKGPDVNIDKGNYITAEQQAQRDRIAQYMGQSEGLYANAPQVQAAQVAPVSIDLSQEQASRGYQDALARQLADQAAGRAPSIAEQQMQRAFDLGLRGQASAMAGLHGPNAGLALRSFAQQQGQGALDLAQQAGIARLAEQRGAQESLAGLSAQMRGQDLGSAQASSGLALQQALANAGYLQQAGLANQSAEEQRRAGLTGARQAGLGLYDSNTQQDAAARARYQQAEAEASKIRGGFLGNVLNAAGTTLASIYGAKSGGSGGSGGSGEGGK